MNISLAKRRYTDEEKRQLIANLDIEVAHRTRQFEAWLADRLENFTIHQEGQVSRIPKQVRSMTMRAFGQKYEGNVQLAIRGFQKERLAAAGADATLGEIDKSMRKRKWVASQETDADAPGTSEHRDTDSQRTTKNARKQSASPKKVAGSSTGPGTAQRSRMLATLTKTPGTQSRTLGRVPASPSPQKSRPPFNNTTSTYNPRPPASARPTSPSKAHSNNPFASGTGQTSRVPSSSSFNPTLPAKTPVFPGLKDRDATMMRLPRKDENMLSVNGSPLANPYEFGLGWFKGVEMAQMEAEDADTDTTGNEDEDGSQHRKGGGGGTTHRTLKRMKSNIIIRRDPSVALASGMHSRTESQMSFYTASSSHQDSSSHSREMSQSSFEPPHPHPQPGAGASLQAFRFPAGQPMNSMNEATPKPIRHQRTFSALVAIPTKDGHLLEFDPLQTSPGTLDALEGISDSAKKQAKVEMGRLIQATVDKWRIL